MIGAKFTLETAMLSVYYLQRGFSSTFSGDKHCDVLNLVNHLNIKKKHYKIKENEQLKTTMPWIAWYDIMDQVSVSEFRGQKSSPPLAPNTTLLFKNLFILSGYHYGFTIVFFFPRLCLLTLSALTFFNNTLAVLRHRENIIYTGDSNPQNVKSFQAKKM